MVKRDWNLIKICEMIIMLVFHSSLFPAIIIIIIIIVTFIIIIIIIIIVIIVIIIITLFTVNWKKRNLFLEHRIK